MLFETASPKPIETKKKAAVVFLQIEAVGSGSLLGASYAVSAALTPKRCLARTCRSVALVDAVLAHPATTFIARYLKKNALLNFPTLPPHSSFGDRNVCDRSWRGALTINPWLTYACHQTPPLLTNKGVRSFVVSLFTILFGLFLETAPFCCFLQQNTALPR